MPAHGEKKMSEIIEQGDTFRNFDLKKVVHLYSAWASFNEKSTKVIKGPSAAFDNKKLDYKAHSQLPPHSKGLFTPLAKNFPKFNEKIKIKLALRYPCGDKYYFDHCEYINIAVRRKGLEVNREIVNKARNCFNDNNDVYEL